MKVHIRARSRVLAFECHRCKIMREQTAVSYIVRLLAGEIDDFCATPLGLSARFGQTGFQARFLHLESGMGRSAFLRQTSLG